MFKVKCVPARFQASTARQMRTALVWVKQRVVSSPVD